MDGDFVERDGEAWNNIRGGPKLENLTNKDPKDIQIMRKRVDDYGYG